MDASNPIISNDRITVATQLEKNRTYTLNQLSYYQEKAKTASRIQLEVGRLLELEEARSIFERFPRTEVSSVKVGELDDTVFKQILKEMPISGMMVNGKPVHPPGRNVSKGFVCANRQFGGVTTPPHGLMDLIQALGEDVLECTQVYTAGTWQGFLKRLKEQMGRKTIPLERALSIGSTPLNTKILIERLEKYMPRDPNYMWPGVHTSVTDAVLYGIKITMKSSAGPPYWSHKANCLEMILAVQNKLIDAIKEDKMDTFFRENPELLLCEVKNKMDRYKKTELEKKTRPYVCVPAHMAFLFSVLTQGFQETLRVFTDDFNSSNAYGFSSANGGMNKFMEWLFTTEDSRVICYGDDSCIAVRKGGKIFRVDPDFKQMDGSINGKDVDLVIKWILKHIHQDSGEENKFWKSVGLLWQKVAVNPPFIVDGKKIYNKINSDSGLMTGVPGTTLFDTVKSVMFWNSYLEDARMNKFDPLDYKYAEAHAKRHGLIIKEGTWDPVEVPEPRHKQLMTNHKFLGMQVLCWDQDENDQWIYVPTIPEEEMIEMLVVQKDNPFEKEISRAARGRTLFDRMRGLMITCGFTKERIVHAIHHVVNKIPAELILFPPQNKARPDHITMQDFEYPDDSGFPSVEFCVSVYSGQERKGWVNLFPDIEILPPQVLQREVPEIAIKEQDPIAFKVAKAPTMREVNKRSKILNIDESGRELRNQPKFLPNSGTLLNSLLEQRGGLMFVSTALDEMGQNMDAFRTSVKLAAAYVTDFSPFGVVSKHPVATAFPTEQERQRETYEKETHDPQKFVKRSLQEEVKEVYTPTTVEISSEIRHLAHYMRDIRPPYTPLQKFHEALQRKYRFFKWHTSVNNSRIPSERRVTATLMVSHDPEETPHSVASATAVNAAEAKNFILSALIQSQNIPMPGTSAYTATQPSDNWAAISMGLATPQIKEDPDTATEPSDDWEAISQGLSVAQLKDDIDLD